MTMQLWYWSITITFMDVQGDRVSYQHEMQATSYTEATSDKAAIIAAFEAVTDCEIVGYTLSEKWYEDTVVDPPSGTQRENTAELLLNPTDPLKPYPTVTIPGAKDSIMMGGSGPSNNIVDITDTDVLALVALFLADGELYVSDGETVTGIIAGERVHVRTGAT